MLDLGANVGYFTLRLAHLLRQKSSGPELAAVLVEGSPRVHRLLTGRLTRQAGMDKGLRVVNGLAGRREGSATLHEIAFHGMNSLTPRRFSRSVDVPFVDLTQLCCDFEVIHLLKCDIEGAEQLVLANYPDLLRKTSTAVFEFHHSDIDHAACLRYLSDAGLTNREILVHRETVGVELFWR